MATQVNVNTLRKGYPQHGDGWEFDGYYSLYIYNMLK